VELTQASVSALVRSFPNGSAPGHSLFTPDVCVKKAITAAYQPNIPILQSLTEIINKLISFQMIKARPIVVPDILSRLASKAVIKHGIGSEDLNFLNTDDYNQYAASSRRTRKTGSQNEIFDFRST